MALDLLITNGTFANGESNDVGIKGDRIVEVASQINAPAEIVYDANDCLVSPPFVDPHFHMDATLSLGNPRRNVSGTLLEGISLWGELRQKLTPEAVKERALKYCDWAVAQGILAIRTHVDIGDERLLALQVLNDVKHCVKPYLTLQLVAFPQNGLLRTNNGIKQIERAINLGADVVGGIPHFERTYEDGNRSVTHLCQLASQYGLPIDLHCDETDDPNSRHIEQLVKDTILFGLQGRATGSHLTSMHSMDNYYVSKLLPLMCEADVSVIANPLINITIQGRHDTYPKRRGLTQVPEMLNHGIRVGWGQDCVLDPWYSFGSADMLDVAHMGLHVAHMTSEEDINKCFKMITHSNAQIIGLENYGLKKGSTASLVVLDAANPHEAIRLRANRLLVVSSGKIVAQRDKSEVQLKLPERPKFTTFRHP